MHASGSLDRNNAIYSADSFDGGRVVDNGSSFWNYKAHWHVQGMMNNSDDENVLLDSYGSSKLKENATTMRKAQGALMAIIDPFALDPSKRRVLRIRDVYLASADSDGDLGDFEIFMTQDLSAKYDPFHSSWRSVKKGRINNKGILNKIELDEPEKFTLMKLEAYANSLSYVEVLAIKAYDVPDNTRYLIRDIHGVKKFSTSEGWQHVGEVPI